jgi:pyruvate dehydrogenase E2 component (dihydrolipoamide acetyltransferase)
MLGIKTFGSILTSHRAAFVGGRRREARPSSRATRSSFAKVMGVTLTCDHRVVDGAVGARFLAAFKEMLEEPLWMII